MNFLNLLTKEKRVAGIEISDSVIRIAFFQHQKKKRGAKQSLPKSILEEAEVAMGMKSDNTPEELILIEEPIASNIIANGVVMDQELLAKTLKTLWLKASLETDYAIVAIQDDKIYSRIFSFPKSVSDTRLTEAMRLAVGFQLPQKTEDVYLDWERTEGTMSTNEIFLSTVPRTVIQGYIGALEKAGIKTLALESQISSIARAVKLSPDQTTIFSKKTPDGTTIFALRNGLLRFSRTLPLDFVTEDQIPEEIKKVRTALISETKGEVAEQDITTAELRDEYATRKEFTGPKSKWLIALGAALRGRIPEGKDNLVSLLPIGTEEAYAYQRATTFIAFMRNLIIGVSIFFSITYVGTYLFMLTLSEDTAERVATLSATTVSPELVAGEQTISTLNGYTESGAAILAVTPLWSKVIDGVLAGVPDGIIIASFTAPSFTEKFSITGKANDRVILNSYKKILQDSVMFTEIELPLTNLEQEGEIPFTISFRLKNPAEYFYSSNQPQ